MFSRARAIAPEITAEFLERSSELLGRDVEALCASGFSRNREVQIAVFVANQIHLRALEDKGVRAGLSLGLSLGEYNHLVHAGALDFEDALLLVDARGQAYDGGASGAMAAVFPLTAVELDPLVARAAEQGELAVSNVNSPTQHVVAGERGAVEALMDLVEQETFATAQLIEERIPMHTARFRPVVETFRPALDGAPWKTSSLPYLPNVTGEIIPNATPSDIVSQLRRHVCEPVLWQRSIETVVSAFPGAVFVEAGPGTVLAGLLRRSWMDVPRYTTHNEEAFASAVADLTMVKGNGA